MTEDFDRYRADEAERHLSRIKGYRSRISTLADTIANLYADVENIKAVDYTLDRVAGGSPSEVLESMLDDKDARMVECQQQAHELECRVRRVMYVLGRMEDQFHASVLEAHYVNGEEWRAVAERVGYAEQHIYRIRFDALIGYYESMGRDAEIPDALET